MKRAKKRAFIKYHRSVKWKSIPLWKAMSLLKDHRKRRTLKILGNSEFQGWGRMYELNKFYPEDKVLIMRSSW